MFSEKEKINKAEGHGITLFCDSAALHVSFKCHQCKAEG